MTKNGKKTDYGKAEAIAPPPSQKKNLSKLLAAFLGMIEQFLKFIPHFSELYEPLYDLKRKRIEFM